jgi:NitT/TauT family transport system ATP-binding protein
LNVISLEKVSVSFGTTQALDGVSLEVVEQEVVALIGPSGCGKSTLLRVVAGILPNMIPAAISGAVTVFGLKPMEAEAGTIDMVFQASTLLPWRTALDNVTLGTEIVSKSRPQRAQELLHKVELRGFEKTLPGKLSGGMRQRVNLAASLITEPKILLMDEPFANLDSLTREKMWIRVSELKADELIGTVLLVTHSIEEAVTLADRIIVMSARPGQITGEVPVPLAWPRITKEGIQDQGFFEIANTVRRMIRNGGES